MTRRRDSHTVVTANATPRFRGRSIPRFTRARLHCASAAQVGGARR